MEQSIGLLGGGHRCGRDNLRPQAGASVPWVSAGVPRVPASCQPLHLCKAPAGTKPHLALSPAAFPAGRAHRRPRHFPHVCWQSIYHTFNVSLSTHEIPLNLSKPAPACAYLFSGLWTQKAAREYFSSRSKKWNGNATSSHAAAQVLSHPNSQVVIKNHTPNEQQQQGRL